MESLGRRLRDRTTPAVWREVECTSDERLVADSEIERLAAELHALGMLF
jgi:hypothetical protein